MHGAASRATAENREDLGVERSPTDTARDELKTLGRSLRDLRLKRGRSQEQVAAAAGVSVGLLSQLERGVGNPSYLTLTRLADALDIPVGHFFDERTPAEKLVVRYGERKRLFPAAGDVVFELLTPDLQGPFEVLWIELSPGAPEPEPYEHEGQEFILVVEGQLTFALGPATYQLAEGDSLTFPGDVPHRSSNPGPGTTRLVVIVAPPSF